MNRLQICALAGCILGVVAASPAHAEEGAALMKKVRAAYGRLNSYTQKISATTTVKAGGRTAVNGQTAELRYQKPNRFYVVASAPAGMVAASSDGREEIIYVGRANVFRRLPAPATARAFAQTIAPVGIAALLDPFAFILGQDPAAIATGFTVRGTATVNGATCRVVTAQIKPGVFRNARSARATIWVDEKTDLLRKAQLDIEGSAPPKHAAGGKAAATPQTQRVSVVEIVQEMSLNPALSDASFTYTPPKGAVEQHPGELRKK